MIEIQERAGGIGFLVRVQPRGSRDAVEGEWQGALKVRLTAPPVGDRANAALCEFLAGILKIPKSAVKIVAGERSRTKRVEIRGVTARQIQALLIFDA